MLALYPHCTTCGQSVGYIPQGTPVLADASLSDASQTNYQQCVLFYWIQNSVYWEMTLAQKSHV
jgi:hypothetical protein